MTIRQIHKTPELPPAHLYLEDVEEMVKVMTAAAKKRQGNTADAVGAYFVVRDRACDSVDDLKIIGGKTTDFKIEAGGEVFRVGSNGALCSDGDEIFETAMRLMVTRQMRAKSIAKFLGPLPIIALCWGFLLPLARHKSLAIVYAALLLLSFVLFAWGQTHSVVEFRYSYEPSPRTKMVKDKASWAFGIVAGVILAEAGRWIWQYLSKWLK